MQHNFVSLRHDLYPSAGTPANGWLNGGLNGLLNEDYSSAGGSIRKTSPRHVRADTSPQARAKLPPRFKENGTVTPGNTSGLNDGVIAPEHPLGASGARLALTVLHELHARQARCGLVAPCIGGGQGIAAVLEILS